MGRLPITNEVYCHHDDGDGHGHVFRYGTRGNVTDIRDTKLLQFYQNAKNDESFLLVSISFYRFSNSHYIITLNACKFCACRNLMVFVEERYQTMTFFTDIYFIYLFN